MSLSIGQTLQGKYVVKKQLGKGGFGSTYLAEHQYLSQNCVLKVPNQELRHDPEYAKFVQKFMQEGQKLAKLAQQRHPHIVRVTDLFEERGLPCLVMDFIAGESLLEQHPCHKIYLYSQIQFVTNLRRGSIIANWRNC